MTTQRRPAPTPAPLPTRFSYVGPLPAVVVVLPSGRVMTVARGEVLDVLPNEAEALTAIPTDWAPAPETKD